jgi:outer membrane lipoprotein-sorting protein
VALDNDIPCDESKTFGSSDLLYQRDKKEYYNVSNPDTKTNYVIIDDEQNIYIYNVNGEKVVRTIPHKDGNVKVNVYPAKEGHMMVSEYNKKERFTRFSIEAL